MTSADERATLVSVARAAGVSRQTVSNALHAPAKVAPETLERVLAAVEELGYRPSLAARQLRTNRSRTLGLRLEHWGGGISGSVLDRFLHALVDEAQGRGYRVVLFTADDDAGEVARYDELLSTGQIDGFVLTSTHHGDQRTAWLLERGVPFATFGRPWPTPGSGEPVRTDHCWVDVDGAAGTRAATEHLLAAGHAVPAYLGWPDGSGTGEDRRRGWAQGLTDAGVDPAGAVELQVPDSTAAAFEAVASALTDGGGAAPTALVCASDSLALGARGAAARLGRPLEVVGFDDTPVAHAIGVSSVAQPLAEAATLAVDLLLAQVEAGPGGPPPARQHLLAPRLVLRTSP
ncbi:LacI family transcriptional regulator [Streptomyces sp. NP160]|uniref:LacI family DNA-binding transcriptional regulator n=1 Tax=Streptomyces sp. NP160 TaxID=2586637 RepID=UPI00111B7E64|nr:LacI family DNA-binding transcriptional regulator [Streptomyces sp. NP160]TNM68914.1 LacI family transcriptional regulator [Streptomyces sp. NP160]